MTSSVLPVMVRSDEGMSAEPGIELPFELEEEVREDEQLGSIEEDTSTIQQSPPRLVPPTSPANKLKPSSRPSYQTYKHADSSASEVMSRESDRAHTDAIDSTAGSSDPSSLAMSSIGGFKLINEPVTIMVAHPKPSETEDSTSSEDPAWLNEISGEDSISTEDSISGEQARQREINFYAKVGTAYHAGSSPRFMAFGRRKAVRW